MIVATNDARFEVQQIAQDEWTAAVAANAAADLRAGFGDVVLPFLRTRTEPLLRDLASRLGDWTPADLDDYVEESRPHGLVMFVMMLTGACNADCQICFTDRRAKPGELDAETRNRVLREARALGARFVYVPGEGEPTLDASLWSMLDTCREVGLHAILFTNGIVFSDPQSCQRYLGTDIATAIARLAEYPVSLYHKLWSFDPSLVQDMMQIPRDRYRYTRVNGYEVPDGLMRLLDRLPRERVGIEVVAERRNADEVARDIVPFAEAHGLSRIVELVQHNGRTLGDGSYDPTAEQIARITPLLSPTSCALAPCKAVVTSRGYLSPRIAILEHQIPGRPAHVGTGPLFDLLRQEYLVRHRYQIHACLCETIPQSCATRSGNCTTVTAPIFNVAATALSHGCGKECAR
jgi:hypothetical protein